MAELYYKTLKNAHTGYTNFTLRQLLDLLVTTYAAIDRFDLEKNQEKMTARYDPNAPIETLFEQISDGVAYTELGDAPFTSKQIVDIALLCLEKRGCSTTIRRSGIYYHSSNVIGTRSGSILQKRTASGRQTYASPRVKNFLEQTP